MSSARELVIVASLPAVERGSEVRLTTKLITGLERYVGLWGGPVRVILPRGEGASGSGNLDDVYVERASLPFAVDLVELGTKAMHECLGRAGLVLAMADYRLAGTAQFCRSLGIPYVLNSEYTLRTRWQIARANQRNPARLARSMLWEWQVERGYLREVKGAAGVQCNGTPTYDAYAEFSPHPLLYFDTRIEDDMLADAEVVERKAARRAAGGSLRLAFSGRLSPMKGADDLPRVARNLAAAGVDFTLDICGAGPSETTMRRQVDAWNLADRVRFRGVLDFGTELVPFIRDEVDLFLCCHKQGDPSCTYLETFACGVPIAGYQNEAFSGLLRQTQGGFGAQLGDPVALARVVESLVGTEGIERTRQAGHEALEFARRHTFNSTFERRVHHMQALAR